MTSATALTSASQAIRQALSGAAVVVLGHPSGAAIGLANDAIEHGANLVCVVAGPRPADAAPDWQWIDVGGPFDPSLAGTRHYLARLAACEESVRTALDQLDPTAAALILGFPYLDGENYAGRRRLGALDPQVHSLQRPDLARQFIRACEQPLVTGIELDPRTGDPFDACSLLDLGHGTRWFAHSDNAVTFDDELVMDVADSPEAIAAAQDLFARNAERVTIWSGIAGTRVMADFLFDGTELQVVDISAKGSVRAADGRDVLFLAREPGLDSDLRLDQIRRSAATIAARLGTEFGFRGAFALEGIAPASEAQPVRWFAVHTRPTGGLTRLFTELQFPIGLYCELLSAGEISGSELQSVASAARRHRARHPRLSGWLTVPSTTEHGLWYLRRLDDRWQVCLFGESPDLVVQITQFPGDGDSAKLRVEASGRFIEHSPDARAAVIEALAHLDAEAELGLGQRYQL